MRLRELHPFLAVVVLGLGTLAANCELPRTTPVVELPALYVPRPLPENCGVVFGDVWCFDVSLLANRKELSP